MCEINGIIYLILLLCPYKKTLKWPRLVRNNASELRELFIDVVKDGAVLFIFLRVVFI